MKSGRMSKSTLPRKSKMIRLTTMAEANVKEDEVEEIDFENAHLDK